MTIENFLLHDNIAKVFRLIKAAADLKRDIVKMEMELIELLKNMEGHNGRS